MKIKKQPSIFKSYSSVFLLFLIIILQNACTSESIKPKLAFYYWKTQWEDSPKAYLDSLDCQTLYLKFFDVDITSATAAPVPVAMLALDSSIHLGASNIIPTVFITNRSITALDAAAIPDFAHRISSKISNMLQALPPHQCHEWQIDCDWTGTTRERYFQLLSCIKKEMPKGHSLSATIRLHQIKYPTKTGIPPIDKGMLMCYNTGNIDDPQQASNSILSPTVVSSYLADAPDYPLHLDIALPIFRWGLLYRDGALAHIFNNLTYQDMATTKLQASGLPNQYHITQNTYQSGFYLYADDVIRFEAAEADSLRSSYLQLHDYLPNAARNLAIYQLDSTLINSWTAKKILGVME